MSLLPVQTEPAYGDGASTFMTRLVNYLLQLTSNDQLTEDRYSWWLQLMPGMGILCHSYTSPILSAGSGLVVDISACQPMIPWPLPGFIDNIHHCTVPDNQSNIWIWCFSDGTTVATTTSDNPGSVVDVDTGLNTLPAILLGEASTSGGSVTSTTDDFNIVCWPTGGTGSVTDETMDSFTSGNGGAWDADAPTRTGGTTSHYTLTLSAVPTTQTVPKVFVGKAGPSILGVDYTLTDDTLVFLDGGKPILDPDDGTPELVRVFFTPTV